MSSTKKIAVVTGASGFIGSHVVNELSKRGYQVRGTVRDTKNKSKTAHLTELFPNLELFEADLMSESSFDAVMSGAEYVFHTASPFQMNVKDGLKDLVEPAVNGTTNVIQAALKAKSVKKIVLTSSMAAVRHSDVDESYVFTDKDWNTTGTIEKTPYPYSKTAAERKAWELMKNAGREKDLRVINPSFVLGPPLSTRTDSESVKMVKDILDGTFEKKGVTPLQWSVVDVRNIAQAHVEAAEREEASGRYIVANPSVVPMLDISNYLKEVYPKAPTPTKYGEGTLNPKYYLDSSRAVKELGIKMYSWQDTVKDMAAAIYKLGIIKQES